MKNAFSALSLATLLLAASAHAGDWQKDHPRRAQVNKRLANQDERIKEGVKNGQLSKDQAKELHQEDHAMREQERAEAAEHGGHITKGEQRQLNREENAESRQIHEEKHP
jgi:hypothetical protein